MSTPERRDAVAGIVQDLCHAIGEDWRDVIFLEIASGTVNVRLRDACDMPYWKTYTWRNA